MPRIIAFYLPQFHPIPENDEWWGAGFTEWHNVARARPLFRGHRQPVLPGELGFYDLRLAETREQQASLARRYGVAAFCYWHYWFAGKRLLERPLDEVVGSGTPDFPFCIGWANESWTGVWHGAPRRVLVEQTYPPGDAERHYEYLRTCFRDERYVTADGRPLLYIYKPRLLPEHGDYLATMRRLARKDGYPDLLILGTWTPNPGGRFDDPRALGMDGAVITNLSGRDSSSALHWLEAIIGRVTAPLSQVQRVRRISYREAARHMLFDPAAFNFKAYPCVFSNWDNTPRSGRRGLVLTDPTPEAFGNVLKGALRLETGQRHGSEASFVFLKSWNEWAEGNYVEPDHDKGRAMLEAIASAVAEPTHQEPNIDPVLPRAAAVAPRL